MTAYCTQAQVTGQYGRALTSEQAVQVTAWQTLAEEMIDAAVPGHWGGAVTGERLVPTGPLVWLQGAPIVSVEAIRGAWRGTSSTVALALTTEYEVDSLADGRLYVPNWGSYAALYVDYTAGDPPVCVQEATAALLAEWLTRGPGNLAAPLQSVRLGAFSVQRSGAANAPALGAALLPPRVQALLAPVRRLVFA